ncbi:DUF4347 domain-containing protein [Undibacterium seohonense]|uniref:DUF4347 domain-containing protein n=1 Tax=Undibacterium seohonense TaxID=1344950 RepID=A0ABR6X3C6_9BURK|nr:Ig-like domain-containing protein [Undibacterium seohonense]MBC3807178.1 DUF4347 domain-containing protein [Undibacterium seohonense]
MTMLHVPPFNPFSTDFTRTSELTQEGRQVSTATSELLLPVQPHSRANAIVFIDSRLPDFEQLLAAVPVGTTVVILDKTQDGLQQIAAALKDYQNLDSISIISHGDDGVLLLGNTALHAANLATYQSELDVISGALNASGDLLLYGCNIAASIKGQNFIQALALATDADIAASTNDTGTAERGGDWILEISTGSIDSKQSFINAEQIIDWNHLAATLSASDLASLQVAMATANSNGVDDTLTLTGDILFIANNNTINIAADSGHSLTIIGSKNNTGGIVTIDGGNLTRVMSVASGAKATVENLVITNGLAAGNGGDNTDNLEGPGRAGFDGAGGGIYNAGELVIINSTITANKASGGGGTGGGYPRGGGGGGGGGFGDGLGGIGGKDRIGEMPTAPSPGHGGNGSGTNGGQRGGFGGSNTGGAGGGATVMLVGLSYTIGGAGATANNGTMSIGGGGGGSGGIYVGGTGGNAVGGIFNSGTLKITNSTISNNIAAGGGGGGGAASNYAGKGNGGVGGKGIGGIWSTGTLFMDSASVATLSTDNKGVGGSGGTASGTGNANGVNGSSIDGALGTIFPYSTPATVSIGLSQPTIKAGDTQGLTFTFSEAVTDFGSADIYIANGVLSGLQTSDNITYTAIFTPNANFESANNQISVNLAGTYNSTNTPGVGITHSSNFVVDTKLPILTIGSSSAALKAGETATITFNFSEAQVGFAANDVAVAGGILSNFGGSGSSYSANFTPTAGANQGSANISVMSGTYTDVYGNSSAAGSSTTLAFDTRTPAVSSVSVPANTTYAIGQDLDFTVNFDENVIVTGLPSIPVTLDTGGTVNATYFSGSNSSDLVFRYTIANGNTDTNGITLGTSIAANGGNITDAAGNNAALTLNSVGSTSGILVDGIAPSLVSINRVSSTPTNASEVDFTVTFSEGLAYGGVTPDDFILSGTGTASGNILATYGSNTNWTVRVDSVSGEGTLRLDLKSSGTGITDSAGNAIAGGYTSGQIYTIDRVMPMVSSIAPTDLVSTNAASCSFTVTFSENVSGVDITDFVVTASNTASASIASIAGTGNIYTVVLNNVAGDGNLRLDLKSSGTNIVDMQGNTISTGFTNGSTIAVDRIAPTLANPIEISDTALKIGDVSTMTINFTEAVVNLDASDFNFSNGSLSNFAPMNGGLTWTAAITANGNVNATNNSITLNHAGFNDLAGNAGSGSSTSPNFAIDTIRPSASITLSDSKLGLSENALVTITFSEAVTNFSNVDITLPTTAPLGSLSPVSSSDGGKTWTATFTPPFGVFDSSNQISIDASGVLDLAGNSGLGINSSANFVIDTMNTLPSIGGAISGQAINNQTRIQPFATITVSDPDIGALETATISLDTPSKGSFTNNSLALSGFYTTDGGVSYLHDAVTPSAMQAAIRALVFEPNPSRLAVNASETTVFNIAVRDEHAGTANNQSATVMTTAVNLTPTNILLSNAIVAQSQGANATVGVLSAVDNNLSDSHTFTLGAANAANDNAKFTILGNSLKVINPAFMTERDYKISVQVSDAGGLSLVKNLTVHLDDDVAPYITSIETLRSPRPTVTTGSYIVKFSEAVTGVSIDDFFLTSTDGTTAHLSSVTALSGNAYRVYFDQIVGSGVLNLNLKTNGTGIADLLGNSVPAMFGFTEPQGAPMPAFEIQTSIAANTDQQLIGVQSLADIFM